MLRTQFHRSNAHPVLRPHNIHESSTSNYRLSLPKSTPPERPNATIHYPLFTPNSDRMPRVSLNATAWEALCTDYPNKNLANALRRIAKYGVRTSFNIEHSQTRQQISANLPTACEDPAILMADLQEQLSHSQLNVFNSLAAALTHFISLLLGLIDKGDGSKCRIHHLSSPPGRSVNDGIPTEFGELTYTTVSEVVEIIKLLGHRTVMIK